MIWLIGHIISINKFKHIFNYLEHGMVPLRNKKLNYKKNDKNF